MSATRLARTVAGLACGCALASPAGAAAVRSSASIGASFAPARLGAAAALTVAIDLGGSGQEPPSPLRRLVTHLPAGLGLDLHGIGVCAGTRLLQSGPAACQRGSLVGRGEAVVEVHAGSQTIAEQAHTWAFRGINRSGHPTLLILSRGETPLAQSTLIRAILLADRAPYGSELVLSIPPIPSVVYEPDASILSMSLTLGMRTGAARRGSPAATITVPHMCPPGGFPFGADLTFADGTTANAVASVACK